MFKRIYNFITHRVGINLKISRNIYTQKKKKTKNYLLLELRSTY